jgi:hypothetical protein
MRDLGLIRDVEFPKEVLDAQAALIAADVDAEILKDIEQRTKDMKNQPKADPAHHEKDNDNQICYCGHPLGRHFYSEPPSTFVPGDPEVELKFEGCRGMAPHNGEKQICPCKVFHAFPFGTYRHLKTGNIYNVTGLGFDSEDRTLRVEYVSVKYGEKWHRPLYSPKTAKKRIGFFDPDEETGRPRYEFIPNPTPDLLKAVP